MSDFKKKELVKIRDHSEIDQKCWNRFGKIIEIKIEDVIKRNMKIKLDNSPVKIGEVKKYKVLIYNPQGEECKSLLLEEKHIKKIYFKIELEKISEEIKRYQELYGCSFSLNSAGKKQEGFDMDFLSMLNLQTILMKKYA